MSVGKRRSLCCHPRSPSLRKNNGKAWGSFSERETAGKPSCSLCPHPFRRGGALHATPLTIGRCAPDRDPAESLRENTATTRPAPSRVRPTQPQEETPAKNKQANGGDPRVGQAGRGATATGHPHAGGQPPPPSPAAQRLTPVGPADACTPD